MKNTIISILFISISITNAVADNKTFTYLLNTPLSLFDAGVMRIQNELKKLNDPSSERPGNIGGVIGFVNIKGDHIVIGTRTHSTGGINNPSCEEMLVYVEHQLLFCKRNDYKKTTPLKPDECKNKDKRRYMAGMLDKYFSHYGYTLQGRPNQLGEELVDHTVVETAVFAESGDKSFCHRISDGAIIKGVWSEK